MVKVRDVILIGLLLMVFMAAADWICRNPGNSPFFANDQNDHLGAEYDEVARAIRKGRGFSDPFHVPTGATAWVAPVLPYLLAGAYWITADDRDAVIEIVLVLKYFTLLLTGWIVVFEARRIGRPVLGYIIIAVGIATDFHAMFQRTYDEWLLLLEVDMIWFGALRLRSPVHPVAISVGWGIFGGFAGLSSPIVGASWAFTTFFLLWCPCWHKSISIGEKSTRRGKMMALAFIVSVFTILPWVVRNRVTLGTWIPIKSNCAYELWQSQCLDDDGVLDRRTLASHPWTSSRGQRQEYLVKGEVDFVASRSAQAWSSISKAPDIFAQRTLNRFVAACLWHQTFDREDQKCRWFVLLRRLIFALPFVFMVILMVSAQVPSGRQFTVCVLIYVSYVFPYVLISYYERYSMPIIGVKMLLVLYGTDGVFQMMARSVSSQ